MGRSILSVVPRQRNSYFAIHRRGCWKLSEGVRFAHAGARVGANPGVQRAKGTPDLRRGAAVFNSCCPQIPYSRSRVDGLAGTLSAVAVPPRFRAYWRHVLREPACQSSVSRRDWGKRGALRSQPILRFPHEPHVALERRTSRPSARAI